MQDVGSILGGLGSFIDSIRKPFKPDKTAIDADIATFKKQIGKTIDKKSDSIYSSEMSFILDRLDVSPETKNKMFEEIMEGYLTNSSFDIFDEQDREGLLKLLNNENFPSDKACKVIQKIFNEKLAVLSIQERIARAGEPDEYCAEEFNRQLNDFGDFIYDLFEMEFLPEPQVNLMVKQMKDNLSEKSLKEICLDSMIEGRQISIVTLNPDRIKKMKDPCAKAVEYAAIRNPELFKKEKIAVMEINGKIQAGIKGYGNDLKKITRIFFEAQTPEKLAKQILEENLDYNLRQDPKMYEIRDNMFMLEIKDLRKREVIHVNIDYGKEEVFINAQRESSETGSTTAFKYTLKLVDENDFKEKELLTDSIPERQDVYMPVKDILSSRNVSEKKEERGEVFSLPSLHGDLVI